jgi:hypothetical protein
MKIMPSNSYKLMGEFFIRDAGIVLVDLCGGLKVGIDRVKNKKQE